MYTSRITRNDFPLLAQIKTFSFQQATQYCGSLDFQDFLRSVGKHTRVPRKAPAGAPAPGLPGRGPRGGGQRAGLLPPGSPRRQLRASRGGPSPLAPPIVFSSVFPGTAVPVVLLPCLEPLDHPPELQPGNSRELSGAWSRARSAVPRGC